MGVGGGGGCESSIPEPAHRRYTIEIYELIEEMKNFLQRVYEFSFREYLLTRSRIRRRRKLSSPDKNRPLYTQISTPIPTSCDWRS